MTRYNPYPLTETTVTNILRSFQKVVMTTTRINQLKQYLTTHGGNTDLVDYLNKSAEVTSKIAEMIELELKKKG